MARNDFSKIYSATYSNVPVYEYTVDNNHVMRRREDDWINATHILKVAGQDKPTRTRILEREVQKQHHEKVQGGYGKYQGTWIPLHDGRELAIKYSVLHKLQPIFDFVPGDRSPPPAPKHATAASSRPRAPKAPAQPRRQPVHNAPDYAAMDVSMHGQETPDNVTVVSESGYDDYDPHYTNSRKRRRMETEAMTRQEQEFRLWADELLDYFILQVDPADGPQSAPLPPLNADLNGPIDDKGHTAIHWAAAMGDVEVMKDLIRRGAAIDIPAKNGETPLMRAVIFTNSFDRQNMDKIAGLLIRTVNMQEWSGSTVFHHVATTTIERKSKYACARYYLDTILNKMAEVLSPLEIEAILNYQDQNGDTAITIAARGGARRCVRSLIGRNAAVDIPNNHGQTADQLIVGLNNRRQERANRQLSSSPFQGDGNHGATRGGAVQPHHSSNGIPFDPLVPHSSLNGAVKGGRQDVFTSDDALNITAKVGPLFVEKIRTMATNIDAEQSEKNAEHEDAERVASTRLAELNGLRKQRTDLEEQVQHGDVTDDQLEAELAALEAECQVLVEQEEAFTFKRLIAAEKGKQGHVAKESAADLETQAKVIERRHLIEELIDVQKQRKELTQQLTQYLSTLGDGDRQDMYRTLISGALGVSQGDVELMLPDIVSELEEAKTLESVGA